MHQPRRIDKHGPMLLTGVATMDTWSGAAAPRDVWEQLGVIVGNSIRLASEVESGDALG